MSWARVLFVTALASFAVACDPYLAPNNLVVHAYAPSGHCAQGPYEFHFRTLPSLWGQSFDVQWGANVRAHAEIWVDGKQAVSGTNVVPSSGPDPSNRCQLSASDRAAAMSSPGASVPIPSSPVAGVSGQPSGVASSVVTASVLREVPLVPVDVSSADRSPFFDVVWKDVEVGSWGDIAHVTRAGLDIKVLFWADTLQDLHDSQLVVRQSVFKPSSGDDKYLAYLRQKKIDEDARAAKASAKAQAQEEKDRGEDDRLVADCVARVKRNDLNAKCRERGFRTEAEQAADQDEQRRCSALPVADDKCRSEGYGRAAQATQAASKAAAPSAAQPRQPSGPPPQPFAETEPPQPSAHAQWIPGSWTWDGFQWQWLSGGWQVPESDIQSKQTATAPSLPPPPQAEAPTVRPNASAEWTPGYWHWRGAWIWIPGRWAVPPSASVTWRASTWTVEGGAVRLDPGRWVGK